MTDLFGRSLDRAGVLARVGALEQIAGPRQLVLADGQGRGQRLIQIESGGGLSVEVLPDRTLDIGQVRWRGRPVAWVGPNGLRSPWLPGVAEHGGSPMERGIAGLLTTCGFDHVRLPAARPRPPGFLDAHYPLHGAMPFTPADQVACGERWDGDACVFWCEGRIAQFILDGPSFELRRRIEVPLGGAEIRVFDMLENIGHAPAAPMALYHINFGWPLIDDGVRFETRDGAGRWSGGAVRPMGGAPTREVLIEPAQAFEGWGAARLVNPDKPQATAVVIAFSADTLPFVQTWRRTEPRLNVFAVEPISHRLAPRDELETAGELHALEPGETTAYRVVLTFAG